MKQTRKKLKMSLNCYPRVMITFCYKSFEMHIHVVRDTILCMINNVYYHAAHCFIYTRTHLLS